MAEHDVNAKSVFLKSQENKVPETKINAAIKKYGCEEEE